MQLLQGGIRKLPYNRKKKVSSNFQWDKQVYLKNIQVGRFQRKVLKIVELKDKTYILVTDEKFYKEKWNPVGNFICHLEFWQDIVDAFSEGLNNYLGE